MDCGATHVWEDMKKQVAYLEDVFVVEVLENGDAWRQSVVDLRLWDAFLRLLQ